MKKLGFGTFALMATVTLWGTLLGGITYSHLVFVPVYLSALPASAVVVNGPFALNEGVFWLTIHPLAFLSLIISLIVNWRFRTRRNLIAFVLAVYFVILVITQIYFVPELMAFARSPESGISAADWLVRANRWKYLSLIRGAVMCSCIFPLLFALVSRDE